MKYGILGIFFFVVAASAEADMSPEAQVSGPAEESISKRGRPSAENASWEQKRAERREARERILIRLRESSAREKEEVRNELSGKRDETSRMKPISPKRERPFREGGGQSWREDPRMRFPGQDRPMPPPPEYGDPNR